jgi:hypothetical protein
MAVNADDPIKPDRRPVRAQALGDGPGIYHDAL